MMNGISDRLIRTQTLALRLSWRNRSSNAQNFSELGAELLNSAMYSLHSFASPGTLAPVSG